MNSEKLTMDKESSNKTESREGVKEKVKVQRKEKEDDWAKEGGKSGPGKCYYFYYQMTEVFESVLSIQQHARNITG